MKQLRLQSPKLILSFGIALALTACANIVSAEPNAEGAPSFTGVADYYADCFHGKKTASGQLHDKDKLTAAHRTLPFGTHVKLVNRHTGKSCVVVINDRGPFTRNRIIDVSKEAARKLGLFSGNRMVDCYIVDNSQGPDQ